MKIIHLSAAIVLAGVVAFSGCATKGSLREEAEIRQHIDSLHAEFVLGLGDRVTLLERQRKEDAKVFVGNDHVLAARIEGLETAVAPKPKPVKIRAKVNRFEKASKKAAKIPDCPELK